MKFDTASLDKIPFCVDCRMEKTNIIFLFLLLILLHL